MGILNGRYTDSKVKKELTFIQKLIIVLSIYFILALATGNNFSVLLDGSFFIEPIKGILRFL